MVTAPIRQRGTALCVAVLLRFVVVVKMAAGTGKHKLMSSGPTEPWSIREKLCLASSVMRSGDQNWVSVSRAIKPFAEPGRPPDWFSQKHCASQYSELLETTETPKRKRGERGEVVETVEDVIVRKLTAERIEELKKMIKETQEKYRKLKKEAELIQSGHMDSKLEDLWNDVVVKKKQAEDEAELKRKATDAAYQARQAVKNIPRRTSSTMGRSSIGSSSPGGEFVLGDLTPSSAEEGRSGVSEGEMALASGHMTGSGVLVDVGVFPALHGGELQPVPGTIPASPAASGAPTLSRLLEAGPAHFAAPLASFSAAASESPCKPLLTPIESQATIVMMSALPMTAAVPVTQQEGSGSAPDPHTVTVSMHSSDISMIINSISNECLASGESSRHLKDEASVGKGDMDLAEKMDIAVSYTGEELDFETVGDIIAIIEDKVDDHPEVLDVAAVEAALSFCVENDDPQALGGPWDQAVQEHTAKQETLGQPLIPGAKEQREPNNIMNLMKLTAEIKTEPPDPDLEPAQEEGGSVPSHPPLHLGHTEDLGELRGATEREPIKEEEAEHHVKSEELLSEVSQSDAFPNEDETELGSEHRPELMDPVKSEPQSCSLNKDSQEEEEDEEDDAASEVGSPEEPKEEEAGEEYLSEMDNEPPISESDDGFSIHNAHLQSHTLADSIPSSPASSQFSVCSEDQEAIQAQKIWKKAIMLVWRAAANHRYANVFLQPVTDDIAPGYHSIVQRPMDLSTIKKNIETGLIRSTAEFQRDIMLMFQNAVMYNSSDHDVYHMAVEMQRDVLEQIQQFLATQLIMQTSESGISAKSLRGRDSMRKQDASEKDSVPMGSPAFLLSLFMGHELQFGSEWETLFRSHTTSLSDFWDTCPEQEDASWMDEDRLVVEGKEGAHSWGDIQAQLSAEGDHSGGKQFMRVLYQVSHLMGPQPTCSPGDVASSFSVPGSWTEAQNGGEDRSSESTPGRNREHKEVTWLSTDREIEDEEDTDVAQTSDSAVLSKNTLPRSPQDPYQETEQGCVNTMVLSQGESKQLGWSLSEADISSPVIEHESGFSMCDPPPQRLEDSAHSSTSLALLYSNTRKSPQDLLTLKKMLTPVWKMIASHRFAGIFMKPVSDKQAPGYKDVVKRPMDLSTIKRGLSKGRIKTPAEFQRDVMLMLQNAVMYNSSDHHVYHKALEMQRDAVELLQVLSLRLDKRACGIMTTQ
ncbi:bromodomain-containing protein 8 isoform X3 [Ascaphus truei]|uniref:bromodomain-containing protein 8 isoform X3 n=1 Tax=Ascaphus truei TaxID=8439 RepID=UPI003F593DDD